MKQYRIEVTGPRDKVAIIKCLRKFNHIGLKQAKDLVEQHIGFDDWLDNHVTFTMIVTAEQLGTYIAHQIETRYAGDHYVNECEELKPTTCDINIAML